MKLLTIFILLILFFSSCQKTEKQQISISGNIISDSPGPEIVFWTFGPEDKHASDTIKVGSDGNYEYMVAAFHILYIEILNGENKIKNAAIIALMEHNDVHLNIEVKESTLLSKQFEGRNAQNMAYADELLNKLMFTEQQLMLDYIGLEKENRNSFMPQIRNDYLTLNKQSVDAYSVENSDFRKQLETFKNIVSSYYISVIDYYDDIKTDIPTAINPEEITKIIPATSPLWETNYQLPIMVFSGYKFPASIQGYSETLKSNIEYLRELVISHPNNDVAGYTINFCLPSFMLSGDTKLMDEFSIYFNARNEYCDNVRASFENYFSPSRAIKVGNQLPAFEFVSMEDKNVVYSNKTFEGKIYLIDFWATWCEPCMKEMQSLHKTYEKYKGTGKFDILSVSIDSSPVLVENFKRNKWEMPWKNVVIVKGKKSREALMFEVNFIPKMILVDGNSS